MNFFLQNFIKNNPCKVSRRRARDRDRNPSRPRRDLQDRDFKKRFSGLESPSLAKALKIRVKIAPNVVWFEKMAPIFALKHMKTFIGGYTKNRSSWSLWEKICRQKLHKKLFGQIWRTSGKILRTSKFACSYTYDKKAPRLCCPSFERAEEEMPSPCLHSRSSLCVVFYTYSLFTRCCTQRRIFIFGALGYFKLGAEVGAVTFSDYDSTPVKWSE